jgi:hypothetical protein
MHLRTSSRRERCIAWAKKTPPASPIANIPNALRVSVAPRKVKGQPLNRPTTSATSFGDFEKLRPQGFRHAPVCRYTAGRRLGCSHPFKAERPKLSGKRNNLAVIASAILGVLIIIASLVVYVPVAPVFPSINLDGGWAFALNAAVERGLVFGRDIVFTFGPYGAAYTELYYPATDKLMLASATLLGIAFAAGLLCLAQSWAQRIGALLIVVLMAAMARDALFFALPFMLILLTSRLAMPQSSPARLEPTGKIRIALALLVFALSLLPLVKGTFSVASGMAMLLSVIMLIARGQLALAIMGVALFALATPLFWVLAGQPLDALPGFVISQGPIVSGYTEAMSVAGGLFLPAQYVVCCLLLAALHFRAINLATIGLALGTAASLFFAFKGGFVRADTHMMMAGGLIAIVSVMLAFGHPGPRSLLGVAIGLTSWGLIDVGATNLSLAVLPPRIQNPFTSAGQMLVTRIARPERLARLYGDSLAMIAAQNSLPDLKGTTDIYSYGQSILLARNLAWAPRPVLQSYSAYTPSLAQADADFLASPKAPDNILFSVEPIDSRLGALEDGLSWPQLLTRYTFTELRGDMAILRRRDQAPPPAIAPTPLRRDSFAIGELVKLPASPAALWAEFDVSPTFLGRLVSTAFRPPRLTITFGFADGHSELFRYIPGMGKGGFLIAPVVTSTADFVALTLPKADEYLAPKRPVSFSINADHGVGLLWNKTVSAQISTASFPSQDVGPLLFDRVETEATRLVKLPTTPDCSVDLIDMHHPENLPVQLGHTLRVDGWAAISVRSPPSAPKRSPATM